MAYDVLVTEDGEERQVLEVDQEDSGDPTTVRLIVYVSRDDS
jgi:hypothetical protein